MDNQNQLNIRRLAFWSLAVIVIIVLLIWLVHYFTTGKIIITTNNPNNKIMLTKVAANNKSSKTFTAHSKLSVSLGTGQYVASVEGNSQATTQLIKLGAHQTLRYSINPINTTGVQPVAYQNATDITVDNNQLLYLSTDNNNLYKINSQNNVAAVNQSQPLQTIRWANSSFGVGQDSNGHLYTINNGTINKLAVPFSYNNADIGFDVSPNEEIYVSHGPDVYAKNQEGNFKKIYTAKYNELALTAGNNQVAVACEVKDTGDCDQNYNLTTVSTSGEVSNRNKINITSGQLDAFAWSPDGQYLAVPNQHGLDVYDHTLHQITTIPISSDSLISNAQWLDSNTLFYSVNDQLWTYNIINERSEILANMPLADPITELAISGDKSYVYVVTLNPTTNNSFAIRRIGLRNQHVQEFIYQLQDILPKYLSDSTLSLINFGATQSPTITITPFRESNNSPSGYIKEAQAELQQDGFNISNLNFKLIVPTTTQL